MPLPLDYLNRHTTQEELAVLVNDTMGISLTLQLTKSLKKDVTREEVKRGMLGQYKAAGIYIELLEEGMSRMRQPPRILSHSACRWQRA